jgi:hypothetical protein
MEKFSLRPIIPSSSGDNSSMSNPSQLTSESTTYNSHQKHPNDKAEGVSTAHSRRHSVLKSATKNACQNCKKARAKVRRLPQILASTRRCPLAAFSRDLNPRESELANLSVYSVMVRSHVPVATQKPKHCPATTTSTSNMPKRNCWNEYTS